MSYRIEIEHLRTAINTERLINKKLKNLLPKKPLESSKGLIKSKKTLEQKISIINRRITKIEEISNNENLDDFEVEEEIASLAVANKIQDLKYNHTRKLLLIMEKISRIIDSISLLEQKNKQVTNLIGEYKKKYAELTKKASKLGINN